MSVASNQPRSWRATPVVRLRLLRPRHVGVLLVVVVVATLAACAIVPGLIAPYDPLAQDLLARNLQPLSHSTGGVHLLGTDALGRDILSRIVYGTRISLGIGLGSVMFSSAIGIPLGVIAGYRGGRTESVIMRIVDGMLSFPLLVLCIFFLYISGGGIVNVIIVLAVMRWVAYCRVSRALTLPYRSAAFVEAAKSIGCGDLRIMFRHILPNLASPLLVLATLEMATMMLSEAALSFLGVGVPPPQPSWGVMISEGRDYLVIAWWAVLFPGVVLLMATITLNVLATWGRERADSGRGLGFASIRARRIGREA